MLPDNVAWYYLMWPWVGLGAAIVLLILAFFTDLLRADLTRKRWDDPAWLAWIAAVSYMLHNVEEYGIDAQGMLYAFPTVMSASFGKNFPGYTLVAVNWSMIWFVGPLVALMARRYALLGTAMASFGLVNAAVHIVTGVSSGYNAGLLTSVLLFLPIGAWAYMLYLREDHPRLPLLVGSLGGGIFYHVLLFAGIGLMARSIASFAAGAIFMLVNAALTLGIWIVAARRAHASQGEDRCSPREG